MRMKRICTLLSILALGVTACIKTDEPDPIEAPAEQPGINPPGPEVPGPNPEQPAGNAIVPADPPEGDYTAADNVVFLPEDYVATITANDPENKCFYTESEKEPKPGDILCYSHISEVFPAGFLAEVTSVESGVVHYKSTTIEQAFPMLQIDTLALDLENSIDKVLDGEGNEIEFTATKAMGGTNLVFNVPSSTWELVSDETSVGGVPVSLKVTVSPTIEVGIGLRFQCIVYDGTLLSMNLLVDPRIHLGATINAFAEMAAEKTFPLGWIYFTPIVAGPLVFTPKFTLTGYVKVDGQVGVEVTVDLNHRFSLGLGYETGDWRFIYRNLNEEPPFKLTYGTKLEGGVTVGVRPETQCRLYDIFGTSVGADVGLRTAVTYSVDLSEPDVLGNSRLNDVSISSTLAVKGTTDVDARIGTKKLFSAFHKETPEVSLKLFEKWFMPEIVSVEVENLSFGALVHGKLKRSLLTKGRMFARVIPQTGDNTNHIRYIECDWDEPKDGKDGEFSCVIEGLNSKAIYRVDFIMSLLGFDHQKMRGLKQDLIIRSYDERIAQAVADVVSKVASAMGWLDTPWDCVSPGEVMYMNDKGITVYMTNDERDADGNVTRRGTLESIWLEPPYDWDFPEQITIPSNVSSLLQDDESWGLATNNHHQHTHKVKKLVVNDERCGVFRCYGNRLERLEFHSPMGGNYGESYYGSDRLKYMDLSRSGVTGLNLNTNLSTLILDDCKKLEELQITSSEYLADFPRISVRNCPALKRFVTGGFRMNDPLCEGFETLDLDGFECRDFQGTVTAPQSRFISIRNDYSDGNIDPGSHAIIVDNKVEELIVGGLEYVTISNLPNATKGSALHVRNATISGFNRQRLSISNTRTLSISDCPNMQSLSIFYPGDMVYSNLSLSGLDGLTSIYFQPQDYSNNNLTGIVPAVIDGVKSRGGTASYHQRYTYSWYYDENDVKHTDYTDSGWGFYYSGEPEKGYHGQ